MSIRFIVLALAALLSLASAAPASTYVPLQVAAPPEVTDADLYAASVRVFTDRYGLSYSDAAAGVVIGGWMEVDSSLDIDDNPDDNWQIQHAWRAVVGENTLQLAIDCQYVDTRETRRCYGDDRVDSFVSGEARLRHAIFAEAQRRAAWRLKQEAAAAEEGLRPQASGLPAEGLRPQASGLRAEPEPAGAAAPAAPAPAATAPTEAAPATP